MNQGANAMAKDQDVLERARLYSAPWRDRLPNGELGAEYGPPSPAAHARALKRWREELAFKRPKVSRLAHTADADALRMFMRPGGPQGLLRDDIAPGELSAYLLICEQGHSERWAARHLKVSRRTVRVRLARLCERAGR